MSKNKFRSLIIWNVGLLCPRSRCQEEKHAGAACHGIAATATRVAGRGGPMEGGVTWRQRGGRDETRPPTTTSRGWWYDVERLPVTSRRPSGPTAAHAGAACTAGRAHSTRNGTERKKDLPLPTYFACGYLWCHDIAGPAHTYVHTYIYANDICNAMQCNHLFIHIYIYTHGAGYIYGCSRCCDVCATQ